MNEALERGSKNKERIFFQRAARRWSTETLLWPLLGIVLEDKWGVVTSEGVDWATFAHLVIFFSDDPWGGARQRFVVWSKKNGTTCFVLGWICDFFFIIPSDWEDTYSTRGQCKCIKVKYKPDLQSRRDVGRWVIISEYSLSFVI